MNKRIAILLTCFNRCELTKRCLESIYEDRTEGIQKDVYLVNDGCTDGTPKMVKSLFPDVIVLNGSGNLFWNGGMYLAFSTAYKKDYDFYLWVNDDVEFLENPITKLIDSYEELASEKEDIILTGVMVDHSLEKQTYGGIKIVNSLVPLKMQQVPYGSYYVKCDTFHGNCVLIHKTVVKKIGIMDPFYQHAFGDADYGLMASRAGCDIFMTNYPIGVCERHDKVNKWLDPKLSYKERRAAYHAKTANPPRDWKYFCKKFCGVNWWLRYIAPDIKLLIQSILKK